MTITARLTRTYLVECYAPGIERCDVESAANCASRVSAQLVEEGRTVEYLGAMLVPGDEVVFHVFVSDSAHTVREASERASVRYDRVVESVALGQLQLTGRI